MEIKKVDENKAPKIGSELKRRALESGKIERALKVGADRFDALKVGADKVDALGVGADSLDELEIGSV